MPPRAYRNISEISYPNLIRLLRLNSCLRILSEENIGQWFDLNRGLIVHSLGSVIDLRSRNTTFRNVDAIITQENEYKNSRSTSFLSFHKNFKINFLKR